MSMLERMLGDSRRPETETFHRWCLESPPTGSPRPARDAEEDSSEILQRMLEILDTLVVGDQTAPDRRSEPM